MLFPVVQRQAAKTLPVFQAEIAKKPAILDGEKAPEMVKDRLAQRQGEGGGGPGPAGEN